MKTSDRFKIILGIILCLAGLFSGEGKPDKTPAVPAEEQAAVAAFQNALRMKDWEKALLLCSDRVQEAARKDKSSTTFLTATIPVQPIVEKTSPGSAYIPFHRPGQPQLEIKRVKHFVNFPAGASQTVLSWEWSAIKTNGHWRMDFIPTPLQGWIDHQLDLRKRWSDLVATETERSRGIKTFLLPAATEYTLGKPILLRLDLENPTDFKFLYNDSFLRWGDSFTITDDHGHAVPFKSERVQIWDNPKYIEPHQTLTLFTELDVSPHYVISHPGRYKIRFNGQYLQVGIKPS